MLRYQLRNTIFSPAMAVSIAGLYLLLILSLYPHPNDDLLYNFQYAVSIGYGFLFLAVPTVIPICFSLHYTVSQKTFLLPRSRLSAYCRSTLLCTALSGMAVTFCAVLLFMLTCMLYSPEGTPYIGIGLFSYEGSMYENMQPALIFCIYLGIFILDGMLYPMISLLCASFTSNQYIAAAVPFIAGTALSYFAQAVDWIYLDPGQLALEGKARYLPGGGVPYVIAYIGIAAVLCGGIWCVRAVRQVRHA